MAEAVRPDGPPHPNSTPSSPWLGDAFGLVLLLLVALVVGYVSVSGSLPFVDISLDDDVASAGDAARFEQLQITALPIDAVSPSGYERALEDIGYPSTGRGKPILDFLISAEAMEQGWVISRFDYFDYATEDGDTVTLASHLPILAAPITLTLRPKAQHQSTVFPVQRGHSIVVTGGQEGKIKGITFGIEAQGVMLQIPTDVRMVPYEIRFE